MATLDGRHKLVICTDLHKDIHERSEMAQTCNALIAEAGEAKKGDRKLDHRLTLETIEGTSAAKKNRGNIKQKVSKNKRRSVVGALDIDLDLTYITDRIIAMGFPSEYLEAVYRNSMRDVQKFLDARHPGTCRIYNLCSERSYDPSKFHDNVRRFPFDDHSCPGFEDLIPLCEDMHGWMLASPDNVVCVHCKAGKGRTGLVVCSYLLFSGAWDRASEALSYYAFARTEDQNGVTIPSQRRYVHYFERYLRDGPELLNNARPIVLNEIFVSRGAKHFDCVEIVNHGKKLLSKDWGKNWKEAIPDRKGADKNKNTEGFLLRIPEGVALHRDFKVELCDISLLGTKSGVLWFWLHTAFIENDFVELDRSSIDKMNKEKGPPVRIQLFFGAKNFRSDGIRL